MGRASTRQNKTPYQLAREELGLSRERAAELLRYTPGDDVYILYGTDSLALSYKVYDHMKEEAVRHAQDGAEKEAQA